ncbi:hypothetical protein [Blastococcus sp. LR1]|uniref:hypothetical protein n=1 Tax=Blastococcus sp. LR1 TaxID=2877000 RepID=UPI001CCC2369|nr:hypothetical protein [Blastococcus sp. LR1]MCA0145567.1 hypothetical protein [Blastococcus sp. LR1]
MHIRRPLAALFAALALFGGGVTMTGCQAAGQDQNDGTTDDSENTDGDDPGSEEQGNLPDNSNQQPGTEDENDDSQDPD